MSEWMSHRMDGYVRPGDLQHAHLVIIALVSFTRDNQTGSSCCHACLAGATCITLLCDIAAGQCQEHGISADDRAQILPAAQCESVPSCQVMTHSWHALSVCVGLCEWPALQACCEALQTKAACLKLSHSMMPT